MSESIVRLGDPYTAQRRKRTLLELPEFDAPPAEPLGLMLSWFDGAVRREVREPAAAVLATVDDAGRPSSRSVHVMEFDGRGLVFGSAPSSRKGRHLAARPWASLTFHWKETYQQLTVEGPVEIVSAADSDRVFAQRPTSARAKSALSAQSSPLLDEAELVRRVEARLAEQEPVQRPADWIGYRVVPQSIEFWSAGPYTVHRRLRYQRSAENGTSWSAQRLQP
jgi:pyridoxamine 5'-phosphate oxidase